MRLPLRAAAPAARGANLDTRLPLYSAGRVLLADGVSWVPTAVETSAWVARQKAGTTLSVLVAELLAGSAYATRTSG